MNDKKTIIILLLVIVITGIILGLKMTGVLEVKNNKKVQEYTNSFVDYGESIIENPLDFEQKTDEFMNSKVHRDFGMLIMKNLIIFALIFITLHCFFALGLSKIAKNEGYVGWKAWIPIVNLYLLFQVAFDNSKIKWLPIILIFLTGNINNKPILPETIQFVINLVLIALFILALYKIFSSKSEKGILITAITIIASLALCILDKSIDGVIPTYGVLGPFYMFAMRNK